MNPIPTLLILSAVAGTALAAEPSPLQGISDKMKQCGTLKAGTPEAFECRRQLHELMQSVRQSVAGQPPALPPTPASPPPVKDAATVGAAVKKLTPTEQRQFQNSLGNAGLTAQQLQGMDLETAMMAVQSQRANLLETQLKSQIESIQTRNAQVARLNQALGSLNKIAAGLSRDLKAGDRLPPNAPLWTEANGYLKEAGVAPFAPGELGASTTRGQLDGAIQQLKSQIDSLSNSQQMDMLRLQSLSNKRNEAFEVMTNFIKKMQDSRSAIIGNMR